MARRPDFGLIITIAVLLAAAGGLNYYQSKNSPTPAEALQQAQQALIDEEKKAQSQHAAAAKVIQNSLEKTATKPQLSASTAPAPGDFVSGNPKSSIVVTLGYRISVNTEQNPQSLNKIAGDVQAWSAQHPGDMVKIVDLDLPSDQLSSASDTNVPLGLSLNGKPMAGCNTNPGDGTFTYALTSNALATVK